MHPAPKQPVPVFPLPGVVLFPHTMLPLHVFELRYRTMVRDALSGERTIALALLKPGYESDYHASPEFFPVGCLARFEEVEWLTNDCFDLKVLGVSRVRFQKIVSEFPYRSAKVEMLPQVPYTEDDPLVQLERRALLEACARAQAASENAPDGDLFPGSDGMRYEALVNCVCMMTNATPAQKLELLDMDSVLERGRRVREMTERMVQRPQPRPRPDGDYN